MENYIIKESFGIKYLQFKKLLDLGITNAYTLKDDGIDFTTGREEEDSSYLKLCNALGIPRSSIVEAKQKHTDIVLDACDSNLCNVDAVDGLITNKKDIALVTKNADCILFLFYDPKNKVIANVHSGWKGTFKRIAEKAVKQMINDYNSKVEDILCFISPSIRKCHFEVDEDVKDECVNIFSFTNRTNEFIIKGNKKDGKQKYFIDTVLINRILLESLGIKSENIFDTNLCSVCNSDIIASARAEGEGFKHAVALIKM